MVGSLTEFVQQAGQSYSVFNIRYLGCVIDCDDRLALFTQSDFQAPNIYKWTPEYHYRLVLWDMILLNSGNEISDYFLLVCF